jgi:CDGSH-type Zn-finger protein
VVVTVKKRGPLVIEGPVEIRDQDGNLIVPPPAKRPGTVKLCGCGRTKTKPFCDETHKEPES